MAIRAKIEGKLFGRLTVVKYLYTNKRKEAVWECLCDCGNSIKSITHNLANGNTLSCGCIRKETASKSHQNPEIRMKMASSKRIPKNNNSLADKFPEIAKEWHPVKNGLKTPNDINHGSSDKVWWLGKCGHEWECSLRSRTGMKCGCPICQESKGEKRVSEILNKYNIYYETQKSFKECKNINVLLFDFYLPNYNTVIEYQGSQHFVGWYRQEKSLKLIQHRDLIKKQFCINNNIRLIEINYIEFNNIENIITNLLQLETEKC